MKKIILIVIIGLIVFFLYTNGSFILTSLKFSQSKYPLLYKTPVAREVSCPSFEFNPSSSELSYYGLRMQVPWNTIVDRRENKGSVRIIFENNKNIVLFDEKQGIKDTFLQGDVSKAQKIKDFMGEKVLSSNYAFYTALLSVTPSFFGKNILMNATVKSILIVLKATIVPPFSSGEIYNFDIGTVKGFQFGDASSRLVVLDFFDTNDRMHSLAVSGASQGEIDCVLSSIAIE